MINRITNEYALKELIMAGIFPAIEEKIRKHKESEDASLYSTLFDIGEFVNTYHEVFMTGNSVNGEVKNHRGNGGE